MELAERGNSEGGLKVRGLRILTKKTERAGYGERHLGTEASELIACVRGPVNMTL